MTNSEIQKTHVFSCLLLVWATGCSEGAPTRAPDAPSAEDAGAGAPGALPSPAGGAGGMPGGGGSQASGQAGQAGGEPAVSPRTGCWWDAYESTSCSQTICGAEDVLTLDYLPSRLTAFGDRLYWLNFTAAEVVSAPKDGSQPPQVIWKAAPLPDHVGVRIFELSPTQAGVVVSTRNIVSFAPSVYSDVVYLISSAGEAKELFRVAGAVASLGANAKDA